MNPEVTGLPVWMYLLGGLAGFLLGLAVGYCNMCITKHSMKKQNGDGVGAVMGTNVLRQFLNFAALAVVFLLRNIIPLPFYGTIIGTAFGLSVGNVLFIWLLTRQMERQKQQQEDN